MTPETAPVMLAGGATGVVGRHLLSAALARGYRVRLLTRNLAAHSDLDDRVTAVVWEPRAAAEGQQAALETVRQAMEGADLVVNLAGASIGEGRLNDAHKARVLSSRVQATTALLNALRRCEKPPSFWFQASATGYYGDTGEAEVTEESAAGDTFLADVCVAWEGTAAPVAQHAAPDDVPPRLCVGRIGLVLARDAPAWQKLIKPVRLGAGGSLGSGSQWWAWIDADDLARAILFLREHEDAVGAFNLTSPEPVRQIELTRQVARRLHRPSFLPAPGFLLRMVLGEAADLLLLASCKALPQRLEALGFAFERPDLASELDDLLSR